MFSNSSKKSFEAIDLASCGKGAESSHVLDEKTPSDKQHRAFNFPPNNRARADDHPFLGTKDDRKFEYLDCDSEESIRQVLCDSSSYNSENENHGKYLRGKIIKETEQEIVKHIEGSSLNSVQLRVRSPIRTMLTARIVLDSNKGKINVSNILTNDFCKDRKITAVTLLLPGDEKRGVRGRIDEHGTRIYEVANGSYDMTLNWYVEGKECKMKINISDDGSVKFIESNGVTWEQLAAHKEVKVGRQYEAKPLYEALSYLRRENSEIVEFSQQPSTNIGSVSVPQQLSSTQGVGK